MHKHEPVTDLRKFLQELEDRGEYSRAATVAIFCLQIRLATQILQRGGERHDRELSVVAMALSGFSEERSGALWREMVGATAKNMADPYLRAMFTFLLAISGNTRRAVTLGLFADLFEPKKPQIFLKFSQNAIHFD